MQQLLQDFRYSIRQFRKTPGLTAIISLALALGIGANTTIFSLITSILFRPLPYKNPEQLVFIWERTPKQEPSNVSTANFMDWKDSGRIFDRMAAVEASSMILTDGDEPERIPTGRVSADFFTLLGVQPALGRAFRAEEDKPGAEHVAVLSHGLWERRFGSDPGIIGRAATLNYEKHLIIGVAPAAFRYYRNFDLFVPIALDAGQSARDTRNLAVLARLKPDVSIEQAGVAMDAVCKAAEQARPQFNTGWGAMVEVMQDHLVEGPRQDLPVLLGAAVFVLLIACINVAGLLFARAAGRRHEIAIRAALGAGRARLIRQLLTESVLLAALAGGLGLVLAVWSLRILERAIPPAAIPAGGPLSLDTRVLCFTLAISVLTGLTFGIAPALQGTKLDLSEALKQADRGITGRSFGNRFRGALVVAEIAFSFVLLTGAGLLIATLAKAIRMDSALQLEKLLSMQLSLPPARYTDPDRITSFFREALERIEAVPGVQSAGLSSALPMAGSSANRAFEISGRPSVGMELRPSVPFLTVSSGYFTTMGIGLKAGRPFDSRDTEGSAPVAIVNEAFARRFFSGEDAIGQRLRTGPVPSGDRESRQPVLWEVIGVAENLNLGTPTANIPAQVYVSYLQNIGRDCFFLIRTTSEAAGLALAAPRVIRSIDAGLAVTDVKTFRQIREAALTVPRVLTGLMAGFGGLALLLAALGIYGLVSYTAALRSHELALRKALGAETRLILLLVMRQGAKLALYGLSIGLAGAFALFRLLRGLVFGVPAYNLALLAGVMFVLLMVALFATFIPARRAALSDPMILLRGE